MFATSVRNTVVVFVSLLLLTGCTERGELPDLETAKRAYEAGDVSRAMSHYRFLAEKGYPEAKMELAKISAQDKRVLSLQEKDELVRTLEKIGKEENLPSAYEAIAAMYLSGEPANVSKAIEYLRYAYEAGSLKSAIKIGDAYIQLRRPVEATRWYATAFRNGENKAIYRIGRIYESGKVMPRTPVKALAYYLWAQELGVEDSPRGIGRTKAKLSTEDQKKAADMVLQLKSDLPMSY